VCGAREWTDETNGAQGRKIRPVGDGSVLKGSGGEGAGRGGRRVEAERERERERGALARRGAVRQRGVGAAAARQRRARATGCRATVEDGGVNATRVNVADRWSGTRRGPGRQWLGAAQR
jgi:hypothetical protein